MMNIIDRNSIARYTYVSPNYRKFDSIGLGMYIWYDACIPWDTGKDEKFYSSASKLTTSTDFQCSRWSGLFSAGRSVEEAAGQLVTIIASLVSSGDWRTGDDFLNFSAPRRHMGTHLQWQCG